MGNHPPLTSSPNASTTRQSFWILVKHLRNWSSNFVHPTDRTALSKLRSERSKRCCNHSRWINCPRVCFCLRVIAVSSPNYFGRFLARCACCSSRTLSLFAHTRFHCQTKVSRICTLAPERLQSQLSSTLRFPRCIGWMLVQEVPSSFDLLTVALHCLFQTSHLRTSNDQ